MRQEKKAEEEYKSGLFFSLHENMPELGIGIGMAAIASSIAMGQRRMTKITDNDVRLFFFLSSPFFALFFCAWLG